jgi:hypothetical protein
VIRACTHPLDAVDCSGRSGAEQSHGYENDWEEAYYKSEDEFKEERRRASRHGREKDSGKEAGQTQDRGGGPQDRRTQNHGTQDRG